MTDPPLLALRGVSREYHTGRRGVMRALRDVNLTMRRGDYWSVEGPSGSGKSTLLNLIGLLDRPTSGTVAVDGRDVARLAGRERDRLRGHAVGFVFQSYHLLRDRDVLENAVFATCYQDAGRRESQARAREVLASVGLGHRLGAYPDELSGGERQRLAMARALTQQPDLLLCDEPTGNLDRASTSQLLATLAELNDDGLTVLVVSHDADVCAAASSHLRLESGRVAEMSP